MKNLRLTKRRLKQLGIGLAIALLLYLFPQILTFWDSQTNTQPGFYTVTAYSDGDTVSVNMNGKQEEIRFIGVDTPESHHPNKPKQCYSTEAGRFLEQTIRQAGGNVRLMSDPMSDNRDRYDRLLRYVYTSEGTLLNKHLIEEGYGFAYTLFPFSKQIEFVAAQNSARSENQGLWQSCSAERDGQAWQTNAEAAVR